MNCPIRISYTLRRGDTFYKIAQRYRTTVEILQMENPHMNPGQLMAGDVITICPGVTSLAKPEPVYEHKPVPMHTPKHEHKPAPIHEHKPEPVHEPKHVTMHEPQTFTMPVPSGMQKGSVPQKASVQQERAVPQTMAALPVMPVMPEFRHVPAPAVYDTAPQMDGVYNESAPMRQGDMHDLMRSLWEQQTIWTHELVTSVAGSMPDAGTLNRRLVKGNDMIAALFAPEYEPETALKISELLNANIVYLTRFTQASMGMGGSPDTEWAALMRNTEALTAYICGLGRGFDCNELRGLLKQYWERMKSVVTHRVNKQYPDDVAAADEAARISLMIADILTQGL